jgi:hypothetical protein
MADDPGVSKEGSFAKEVEKWLASIPWQLFATYTFAHRVSDEQARKVFVCYIDRLELHQRAPITCVRGDEKRISGCGKPESGRHFHAVLACAYFIDIATAVRLWEEMAGKRTCGAGADIRPYKAGLGGLCYVVKKAHHPLGDWWFHHLELYLSISPHDSRARRRLRRQLERLSR